MIYGNEENAKKEIEKVDKMSEGELLSYYKNIKDKYKASCEKSRKCTSDFSAWGFAAEQDELSHVIKHIEEKIFGILREADCKYLKDLERKNEARERCLNIVNDWLSDYSKYKTSVYTKINNILKMVKRELEDED